MPDVALQVAAAGLAVLPFESLSDEAGEAYFARGFVEDLIVELSRFPALEVLHPDTSFTTARGSSDLEAYGATLFLRGSVRRSNDVVRVTAQLVEAGSGQRCL